MLSTSKQRGAVLIALLMAVAILMVLYMVNLQGLFGPALHHPPVGIEERPWLLEELLVAEGQSIRLPKSPKPMLESDIALWGSVHRNNEPRGDVKITIKTDGRVEAEWKTTYAHQEKQYALEGSAAGNIDIKQAYEDADGVDKSRLFFIGKGPYRLVTDNPETGRSEENGTVWLLGYLRPNGQAEGTLTLTTDQQWAGVYEYTAEKK